MSIKSRRGRTSLSVQALEARALLSGVTATWIGQNHQDYVGPYPGLKADGVQDIDIRIDNLPTGRTLTSADILGLGGGEWRFNGPYGPWSAAYITTPGSTTGDLFFEPSQVETGRPFNVILTFDDGSKSDLWLSGGPADPNLRMPSASVRASWIGQDGSDHANSGVSVGPDGIQDVHLALSQLSATSDIQSVHVSTAGDNWESGLNPQGFTSAELIRSTSDPSKGDLYLNPDQDLAGKTLSILVTYTNGKSDLTTLRGQSVNPALSVSPAPSLPTLLSGVSATWIGQDGQAVEGAGWARFSVSGLRAQVSVVGATLSGSDHNSWVYQAPGNASYYKDLYAGSLGFHAGSGGAATLAFPPDRDEAGSTLTLRLAFSDGSMAIVPVTAGSTDLGLLSAPVSSSSITASPGDDLNALARQYGHIDLSPGEYDLSTPLVLDNPVSITASHGGVSVVFAQPASASPWTAAIKIHSGNTSLDNFSVRFSGPVRWTQNVNYGPSVIGTTDNLDPPGHNDPKTNLQLTRLNLQAPPSGSPGEEAPGLIRLTTARGGIIDGCTLQGGTSEFLYGPWTIQNNTYLGTMPGTFAWDVFAGHSTHDLVIRNNTVALAPNAGKTWRFLVLTGTDDGARIEGNQVSGIGPRDTDTTTENAAEIILTEAYGLSFEGKPRGLSSDGRILQIPTPQGEAPGSGDVVAILDGPNAGTWVRIAQAISPTTLLLDSPLPSGSFNVSIASGFVNQTYANNTIDTRGSSLAADLDLVGNHYGTRILGNTLLGGADGLLIQSYPTEKPSVWGWSHAPFLDAVISGNTIVDSLHALTIQVNHGSAIKTNSGRTYVTASVTNNLIAWSDSFARSHVGNPASGITLGQSGGIDPNEMVVSVSNNQGDAPPVTGRGPTLNTIAGRVNGQSMTGLVTPLPQVLPDAPSRLVLKTDTGVSDSDAISRDAHLVVGPASRASSYAYRVGTTGSYLAVTDPSNLLPEGLTQGVNTIQVHALDAYGRSGPDATLTFTLDTLAPRTDPPSLLDVSDTGSSSTDQITRDVRPAFSFASDPGDQVQLLRNGMPVASGFSSPITDPGPVPEGTHIYTISRQDAAGNTSVSAPLSVTIDTTAPGPVQNLSSSAVTLSFNPPEPGTTTFYRVGLGPWISVGTSSTFAPEGLIPSKNLVQVEQIDAAGNIGPVSSVVIDNTPIQVSGRWVGQDGQDLVGPYPVAVPDGTQDVHLVLTGLPLDRTIAFIDIQGLGGSQWQYGGAWGPWPVALSRSPVSTSADLYIQPDRIETGRPFQVTIRFTDGFSTTTWIQGGTANPSLRKNAPGRPAPIVGAPSSDSTRVSDPSTTASMASTPPSVQANAARSGGRLARLLGRRLALSQRLAAHPGHASSDSSPFAMLLARRQQRLLAWHQRHLR